MNTVDITTITAEQQARSFLSQTLDAFTNPEVAEAMRNPVARLSSVMRSQLVSAQATHSTQATYMGSLAFIAYVLADGQLDKIRIDGEQRDESTRVFSVFAGETLVGTVTQIVYSSATSGLTGGGSVLALTSPALKALERLSAGGGTKDEKTTGGNLSN